MVISAREDLPVTGTEVPEETTPVNPIVVPSTQNELLISIYYDGKGVEWADLFDNHILAWVIDSSEPPASPQPRSITTHIDSAEQPITDPILSPKWAVGFTDAVYVPGHFRGTPAEFFTWLATNNGAQRKVGGANLQNPTLINTFDQWSRSNQNLVYTKE